MNQNNSGFTEKQIKEIQAISELEGEEKKRRLEDFIESLTEEQKKLLKLSSCIYCSIVNGGLKSFKVYEDDLVACVMDVKPATRGHVVVVPKEHYFVSGQMDEKTSKHVFDIANKLSRAVFEAMGAEGTNILISNGVAAGQKTEHFVVHVIPRYKNDGLKLDWAGLTVGEEEIIKSSERIKKAAEKAIKAGAAEEIKIEEEKTLEDEVTYDEEDRLP